MRTTLLLTAVGPDRTGLVESLAQRIAASGGNWEESRLARLGGQFAGMVLVTIDDAKTDELIARLRELESTGLQVTSRVVPAAPTAPAGTRVRLTVTGSDRAGIVRDVSRILAERAVNVEELWRGSRPEEEERIGALVAALRIVRLGAREGEMAGSWRRRRPAICAGSCSPTRGTSRKRSTTASKPYSTWPTTH